MGDNKKMGNKVNNSKLQTEMGSGRRLSAAGMLGLAALVLLTACSTEDGGSANAAPDRTALGIPDGQWPTYGGGPYNQNFSPLTQINKDNVSDLEVAWTYRYGAGEHDLGDLGLDYRFEITPLLIGGVMYISTPSSPRVPELQASITALVPETGEVLWKFDSPYNIHGRGIGYWPGDADTSPRIFFGTDGGYLMAVDATTGELALDFGLNGQIDAYIGVTSEVVGDTRRDSYTIPNPVTIYKDLIITAARPGEAGPPGPRGDIRGFSAKTGRLQWTFHVLPRPGEPNPSELPAVDIPDLSGANVWSTMTLDPENGILFATTGDINGRGIDIPGPEPFANSLLALNADTGEMLWYRKIVFKDRWDWDSPTPTVLMDLEHGGESVPAVLYMGKQGLMFVFNRLTGQPLNGYEMRPAAGSESRPVPSDYWPEQPWPTAPGPITRTGMTRDEIPDLVPGMKEHCEQIWDQYDPISPGLYALPPEDRAQIRAPASTGGPNWGGGSYNPELGYYFINAMEPASIQGPRLDGGPSIGRSAFSFTLEDGTSISCGPTPWGSLIAIDVRNLEIAWRAPLGITEELGEAGLQTGARNLGGNIATASGLVFIGATNDRYFRAFDASTGELLWESLLPAGGHATPVTYMGADGSQYVVMPAGGGTSVGRAEAPRMSDSLVAFKLP